MIIDCMYISYYIDTYSVYKYIYVIYMLYILHSSSLLQHSKQWMHEAKEQCLDGAQNVSVEPLQRAPPGGFVEVFCALLFFWEK